ncbi:MAG: hypothetical protein ACOC7V_11845 [Spirochaetota bacterium]
MLAVGVLLVSSAMSADEPAPSTIPVVRSFSGSPLLLELLVPDPDGRVVRVDLETEASSISYRVPRDAGRVLRDAGRVPRDAGRTPPDADRDPIRIRVSPFLAPGVHDATLTIVRDAGAPERTELTVSFVDFVFGRDNLSFGNNASYDSVIGTYGEALASWLEERFGGADDASLVLLTDLMYGLFGRTSGRCYSFAGTVVRYWRWPDLLPRYYDSIYDVRGNVSRNQREMGRLQLDIALTHLLAPSGELVELGPMSPAELLAEVDEIERRVAAGEPVAVGFTGPELHHAMVVFGVIRNEAAQTVDLLVANNWKSDEQRNVHSRDAEMITIRVDAGGAGGTETDAPITWRHEGGLRDREVDRLFVVDVARDDLELDPVPLERLQQGLLERFHADGETIVVVENADGAWLTDGESRSGRRRGRTLDEIEGVRFERVSRSYRFACPAGLDLDLEIADDAGARVLVVAPGGGTGEEVVAIERTERPAGGETITRRFELPGVASSSGGLAEGE